jgi:hypothetical protein
MGQTRHIIVTESQLRLMEGVPSNMSDLLRNIDAEKAELETYIEAHGEYMTDVTNDKTYLVQYLKALSEIVGKPYAMCAPVRSDGTYGAFYVKPYDTFRKNINNAPTVMGRGTVPMKRKPNMYQQLGLNK